MKKIIAVLAAAAMLLPFGNCVKAHAVNFTLKTPIQSESAVVVNLDTNTVIHEKNSDIKQMPGPLVNIMVAVICLEESADLDEQIKIDESLFSDLYVTEYPDDLRFAQIEDGDVLTVNDLLYAMMLTSSIEASQTLAYRFGDKSVSAFVEKMNTKAAELGLENTNFTNPTGLYDTNQYTTANDVAKLTEYAITLPKFNNIISTYTYKPSIPNLERHKDPESWVWNYSNTMMDKDDDHFFSGAKGVKTANLEKAGRNIVTIASKDGNTYLVVALKSPLNDSKGDPVYSHLDDAESLLNWAFGHFSYKVILADTAELDELSVELADGSGYVLVRPKNEITLLWYDDIDTSLIDKKRIEYYRDFKGSQPLVAPVKAGEALGKLTLEYSGEELAEVEVVTVSDVERSLSKYNLYAASKFRQSEWFKKALLISIMLCAIYILMCIYSYAVFKKSEKPLKPIYAVPKVGKVGKKKKKK